MKIECDGKVIGIATDEKKTIVKMEIYGAETVIRDLYDIRSKHIEIVFDQDEDDNQVTLGTFEEAPPIIIPLIVDETGKPLQDDDDEGEDPAQYGSLRPCCLEMRIKDGICEECEHDHLKHRLDCPVPNPPKPGMIFCDDCGGLTEEIVARECEMIDGEKKILCPDCLRRTSK